MIHAWTRLAIERESVRAEGAEFRATLATNGEASDGHVLSVAGIRMKDSIPLLFRHDSTPMVPLLGRVSQPEKIREGALERLRVTSRINLESGGDQDSLVGIRQGFAALVRSGDLDAMSIRWDPVFGKFVPRSQLPDGHPAKVGADTEGPARFGTFFEESIALEGSLVAIGADPEALAGRARSAQSVTEEAFWLALSGREDAGAVKIDVPREHQSLFDVLPKLIAAAVREGVSEVAERLREHREEEAEIERPAIQEPERAEQKIETPRHRLLSGDDLRRLMRETAAESAERKIAAAFGRLS